MGVVRNKMIVGIIQARMGSKRLRGKSILPLAGKPLLHRFIERALKSKTIDSIILATTMKEEDDVLCKIAQNLGVICFRGSENDLVDRLYQCAKMFNADVIVRLCADNPLIEAEEIDRIVNKFLFSSRKGCLFSNTQNINNNGYPDGLGAEVYDIRTLEWLHSNIKDPLAREHPHETFYKNDIVETIQCPSQIIGHSNLKLDVNTQEEYEYIKNIYDRFGHNDFHFVDYMEVI